MNPIYGDESINDRWFNDNWKYCVMPKDGHKWAPFVSFPDQFENPLFEFLGKTDHVTVRWQTMSDGQEDQHTPLSGFNQNGENMQFFDFCKRFCGSWHFSTNYRWICTLIEDNTFIVNIISRAPGDSPIRRYRICFSKN